MLRKTLFTLGIVGTLASALAAQVRLNGAGATFPYIIYSTWISTYNQKFDNVEINYQSIGSGGGIRQFSDKTVDFGGTDAPMTDSAIAAIGGNVLHIPTVLGAVVPTYNLQSVSQPVRFTPDVLADIFLGKITNWNDARIASVNPGLSLPRQDIIVVHRSDGSGTSYIWTDYLAKVSPEWLQRVGRGTSVNWPVGLGGRGNEGVTATVRQTPGAIGYVELGYALINKMAFGVVRNKAGNWITPSLESVTTAAQGAMDDIGPNTDFRVSITDSPGAQAYPIASFTWLLLRKDYPDAAKAREPVKFVWWSLTEGQAKAPALGYAPLPKEMSPWIPACRRADRSLYHRKVRMNAHATSHRHFHDELSELKVALLNMSGEAQAALAAAVDAVLQRDGDKARIVIAGDKDIDHLELEVEEKVIRLLATQQPMARDLRFLTAAMKIANDLERVGDHAVNIAQSAERLLASRPIVPEPELLEMARQARTMLADALDAFVRGDAQAGRAICRRDDSVDALHASMFRILLTHMMEDPHIIGTAMELFLVSRNLERVADLATNIAEDVVFLVEGKSIKHHAEG